MNHLFPILTALAYLLSFGIYVRFLGAGNKLTGRLGTLFLGLGLITHYLRCGSGPGVCIRFLTMICMARCRCSAGFSR